MGAEMTIPERKVDVVVEAGWTAFTLTVWCDADIAEQIKVIPGVVSCYQAYGLLDQYNIFIDHRYEPAEVAAAIRQLEADK